MKERARSLRQDMTIAENRMWYFLRNRRLKGYKFVREYVIGILTAIGFSARRIRMSRGRVHGVHNRWRTRMQRCRKFKCAEYIYIADFACREKRLVIEIDGSQHIDAAEYDQQRTEHLVTLGYRVLRFWNNDVFNNIEGVLNKILSSIESVPPENTLIRRCAPPSPQGEKG